MLLEDPRDKHLGGVKPVRRLQCQNVPQKHAVRVYRRTGVAALALQRKETSQEQRSRALTDISLLVVCMLKANFRRHVSDGTSKSCKLVKTISSPVFVFEFLSQTEVKYLYISLGVKPNVIGFLRMQGSRYFMLMTTCDDTETR